MENEEKPNYSTLKEEPIIPTPPPSTFPTPAHPFPKFIPKKIALIIIIIFFTVLMAGLITTVFTLGKNSVSNQNTPATVSQSPTPTPTIESTITKPDNWEIYTSIVGLWQIAYPKDQNFKIETRPGTQIGPNGIDEAVIFYMLGPSQTTGTEFHDGISFTIGIMKKDSNQTIKELADKNTEPNPEVNSTRTPFKGITINGLKGFETTVSGLGEFRIIHLEYPEKTDRAYYMAILSDGPGENNKSYDNTVNQMIATFKSTN